MDEAKKKVLKAGKKSPAAGIVFLAAAAALLIAGFASSFVHYTAFDAEHGGYSVLEARYVMGPFAEQTRNGKTTDLYYIVEDENENWYLMSSGKKTSLPVYGEDVDDEDIMDLPIVPVKGKAKEMPDELGEHLAYYLSDTGWGITKYNYTDYFGDYYLDSSVSSLEAGILFYVLAGLFGLIGLIGLGSALSQNSRIRRKLEDPGCQEQMQVVYQDFAVHSDSISSGKLQAAISPNYLVDFSVGKEGLQIIPLRDVKNAFKCNMINGQPTVDSYIAIETDNGRYCFGKSRGKSADLTNAITYLKQKIEGRAQA